MKKTVICLLIIFICALGTACHKEDPPALVSEESMSPVGTEGSVNTPIPTSEAKNAIDMFDYKNAGTDTFGLLGEVRLYNYYLACTYRAVVDTFIKKQHDYDSSWSVTEYHSFAKNILAQTDKTTGKSNRELLQQEALQKCLRMLVMNREAIANGTQLSEKEAENIAVQWKKYGVQYYSQLKDSLDFITNPDTAMELMAGGNVMEAVEYMKIHACASNYASKWLYNNTSDYRDFSLYYQEHINEFRIVTVRAVYVQNKAQADFVRKLMNDRPEHISNLAKAYNEDPKLAETNGLVQVTSKTYMVPDAVKDWAYKQTADTIFSEHGTIEIVQAENGYYLLMCEQIKEYGDEEGNEIYTAVGEAYKSEQLNAYLDELLTQELYKLTEYDSEKAIRIMDESFMI